MADGMCTTIFSIICAVQRELPWKILAYKKKYIAAKFAYAPDRHLTPPPTTIKQFLEFKHKIGITNSVLTQGLSYGSDCTSLKSFVQGLNKAKTKAIGVINPHTVTTEELNDMHDIGIHGIRVNVSKFGVMHDIKLQKKVLSEHACVIGGIMLTRLWHLDKPTLSSGLCVL